MECAIAQQLRGAAVPRICTITELNKYEGVRCPRKGFEDFTTGNFHSAHGVVAIGIWHLCRSVSELIEASDYLNEGL